MDKYISIPMQATQEMIEAWCKCNGDVEESINAALMAAPRIRIPNKYLIEEWWNEYLEGSVKIIGGKEGFRAGIVKIIDVLNEK